MPESVKDLQQKYNRVSAHVAVLYDQLEKKTKELEEVLENQQRQDKMTRTFCQSILRKEHDIAPGDSKKDRAKKEKPWFRMSTVELLQEAEKKYDEYFKSDTEAKIASAEAYKEKIMSLGRMVQEKIGIIRELEGKLEEAESEKGKLQSQMGERGITAADEDKPAPKKQPENLTDNGKFGRTWSIQQDNDASGAVSDPFDGIDDAISADLEALEDSGKHTGKSGFPITQSAGRVLGIKEEKKAASKTFEKELDEYLKTATQSEKEVVLCFGSQGFSELKEIADYVKNKNITEAKTRLITKNLVEKKILKVKNVQTPLKTKFQVMKLSKYGRAIYERLSGKPAVTCMADQVEREHTTLEHGYAIVHIAEALQKTPYVKKYNCTVTYMNRRKQIKVENGRSVVPDIIISNGNDRYNIYIEYETTKCTAEDFYDKCDKFALLTPNMYFIVPSAEALETIKGRVEKWVEKVKKERSLPNRTTTVYMSTARTIKDSDSEKELKWQESIRINAMGDKKKGAQQGRNNQKN